MRYDRLRSIAGRIQTVVGDLATQGERLQSLLSWRDPRATALFVLFCLIAAVILYVTPFQVVALCIGLYVLRHPRLRYRLPSVPLNFFRRLPARTDCMLWSYLLSISRNQKPSGLVCYRLKSVPLCDDVMFMSSSVWYFYVETFWKLCFECSKRSLCCFCRLRTNKLDVQLQNFSTSDVYRNYSKPNRIESN